MSADSVHFKSGMLALMLLAVCPFLSGLFYPFVFDDTGVIIENEFLGEPSNLREVVLLRTIGSPEVIDAQRPVTILSYFLDGWAWGQWPAGYRLTNYLLHAINAGLLFWLVMRLSRARVMLTAVAVLLFAWHPLGIEVVHSPAFREDSLCLMGGLIFLLAVTHHRASWPIVMAGAAGFVFALLSKESGAMFVPLISFMWWLMPETRPSRPKIVTVLFLIITSCVVYGILLGDRGAAQAMGERWNGNSLKDIECILTPSWLFLGAFVKIIIPWPLSVDYRVIPVASFEDFRFWAGIVSLLLVLILAWKFRRSRPVLSMGLFWMLVMFAPVSNVWPLFNPVADRYAYLMIPGIVLLVPAIVPADKRWGVVAVGIVALVLAVLTVIRIPDWRDERTLWTAALDVEPRSARANAWLGIIENAEGRPDNAFNYFDAAQKLNPQDPGPWVNMGVARLMMNDPVAAEYCFREALRLNPNQKQARENLQLMGLAP